MKKRLTRIRMLEAYAVISMLCFGLLFTGAFTTERNPRFQEIDVERINLVEPDGSLRLVLANRARSPGVIYDGREYVRAGTRPGLIFFNDEGKENGGLIWSGRMVDGVVRSTGHLSFDQYRQDQVVALQYIEGGGQRRMGLTIMDRPDVPLDSVLARREVIIAMPEGAEKSAAWAELAAYQDGVPFGAPRLFAGRDISKSSVVNLSDRFGRVRLQLMVDSAGAASLRFLDEQGEVVYRLPEEHR
jgi:hypothetical protein